MRVGVWGSRDFARLELVRAFVHEILVVRPDWTIVSGGARGVDTAAEHETLAMGYVPTVYRPEGKAVFWLFARNAKMAQNVDRGVSFWNGHSAGTMDMMERCGVARSDIEGMRSFDSAAPIRLPSRRVPVHLVFQACPVGDVRRLARDMVLGS